MKDKHPSEVWRTTVSLAPVIMARMHAYPQRAEALTWARVLVLTGHRPESLRRLRAEDVDFRRGTIRWAPIKHNRQWNEVPMSGELHEIMADLTGRAQQAGRSSLLHGDPRRAFQAASREAGLPEAMTPRMFRHFWTTRALEAGIPVAEVAAMRGDRDGGAMLLRTYAHPRLEQMRAAVQRLPGSGAKSAPAPAPASATAPAQPPDRRVPDPAPRPVPPPPPAPAAQCQYRASRRR